MLYWCTKRKNLFNKNTDQRHNIYIFIGMATNLTKLEIKQSSHYCTVTKRCNAFFSSFSGLLVSYFDNLQVLLLGSGYPSFHPRTLYKIFGCGVMTNFWSHWFLLFFFLILVLIIHESGYGIFFILVQLGCFVFFLLVVCSSCLKNKTNTTTKTQDRNSIEI